MNIKECSPNYFSLLFMFIDMMLLIILRIGYRYELYMFQGDLGKSHGIY